MKRYLARSAGEASRSAQHEIRKRSGSERNDDLFECPLSELETGWHAGHQNVVRAVPRNMTRQRLLGIVGVERNGEDELTRARFVRDFQKTCGRIARALDPQRSATETEPFAFRFLKSALGCGRKATVARRSDEAHEAWRR